METIPILLTKSSEGVSPIPGLREFYTATGFGAYRVSISGSGSKFLWGGYAGVGTRLPGSLFAELQYHQISGSVGGATPNGVAFLVGKRF